MAAAASCGPNEPCIHVTTRPITGPTCSGWQDRRRRAHIVAQTAAGWITNTTLYDQHSMRRRRSLMIRPRAFEVDPAACPLQRALPGCRWPICGYRSVRPPASSPRRCAMGAPAASTAAGLPAVRARPEVDRPSLVLATIPEPRISYTRNREAVRAVWRRAPGG